MAGQRHPACAVARHSDQTLSGAFCTSAVPAHEPSTAPATAPGTVRLPPDPEIPTARGDGSQPDLGRRLSGLFVRIPAGARPAPVANDFVFQRRDPQWSFPHIVFGNHTLRRSSSIDSAVDSPVHAGNPPFQVFSLYSHFILSTPAAAAFSGSPSLAASNDGNRVYRSWRVKFFVSRRSTPKGRDALAFCTSPLRLPVWLTPSAP